jgi:hypothetical protein
LAQLVYETTDTDFADRALEAMRQAHILCYRTGQGYQTEAWYSGRGSSESQVCIYIERDTDFAEANRILIGLGAVEERPPPLRLVLGLLLIAAILAIWAALAWNT